MLAAGFDGTLYMGLQEQRHRVGPSSRVSLAGEQIKVAAVRVMVMRSSIMLPYAVHDTCHTERGRRVDSRHCWLVGGMAQALLLFVRSSHIDGSP